MTFLERRLCLKKLTFCLHLYTHRSLSLWNARYPAEIRLERSGFGGRHFETVWQPGRVYMTSFRPTRNCRKGEKLGILHKVNKIYIFYPTLWTLILRSLEHVWLKIIWLKSSHNPVWYKRFFGRHLDKISQKERRNENAARLLSTVENGSKDVRILCFFGDKLSKKTHTLQGETSVTALKNIRFLEWPPLR